MTIIKEDLTMSGKKRPWYVNITVEPVMFFYMIAFMITNVVEQTFYLFQTCKVNHGYSEDICYNLSQYTTINDEVQVTASTFHQWNGIAGHIVPLLLAFFLGSYSDKRGRKVIIVAGLLGKLYFSLMIIVNTLKDWPVEYVIYTAAFPSALTGADLAIFAGCFAYVADISSVKNRTFRVGILDVVYLSTMPIGLSIGNLLYYKVVDRSFTAMFAINATLMAIGTLYAFIALDWQTRPEQKSLKQAHVKNPITDFFDLKNIVRTVVTLTKKRSHNRRLFLWFFLISMAFYTFQRDERPVMYMYTTKVFGWDSAQFSNFRTYLSSLYVIAMLFGIPLMTKIIKMRDTMILMIGATAHITGHMIYAHATVGNMMYVGATAASLGPIIGPLLRSMTSKILPPDERGIAYAFLSVMENAVAMFAAVTYSMIYKATLDTNFVNAIFYLTVATQVAVFLCAFTMEIMLKGKPLESILEENEEKLAN